MIHYEMWLATDAPPSPARPVGIMGPVLNESPEDNWLLFRSSLSQGFPVPLWIVLPHMTGLTEVRQVPLEQAANAQRLGSPPSPWALAQRKGEVDKDLSWAPM